MKEQKNSEIQGLIARIDAALAERLKDIEAVFTDEFIDKLIEDHNIPASYFPDLKPILFEAARDFLDLRELCNKNLHQRATLQQLEAIEGGIGKALDNIRYLDSFALEELFQVAEGGHHVCTPSYLLDRYASMKNEGKGGFIDFHRSRTGYRNIVEWFESLEQLHKAVATKIAAIENDLKALPLDEQEVTKSAQKKRRARGKVDNTKAIFELAMRMADFWEDHFPEDITVGQYPQQKKFTGFLFDILKALGCNDDDGLGSIIHVTGLVVKAREKAYT